MWPVSISGQVSSRKTGTKFTTSKLSISDTKAYDKIKHYWFILAKYIEMPQLKTNGWKVFCSEILRARINYLLFWSSIGPCLFPSVNGRRLPPYLLNCIYLMEWPMWMKTGFLRKITHMTRQGLSCVTFVSGLSQFGLGCKIPKITSLQPFMLRISYLANANQKKKKKSLNSMACFGISYQQT